MGRARGHAATCVATAGPSAEREPIVDIFITRDEEPHLPSRGQILTPADTTWGDDPVLGTVRRITRAEVEGQRAQKHATERTVKRTTRQREKYERAVALARVKELEAHDRMRGLHQRLAELAELRETARIELPDIVSEDYLARIAAQQGLSSDWEAMRTTPAVKPEALSEEERETWDVLVGSHERLARTVGLDRPDDGYHRIREAAAFGFLSELSGRVNDRSPSPRRIVASLFSWMRGTAPSEPAVEDREGSTHAAA